MGIHAYSGSVQHAALDAAKNLLVLTPAAGYKCIVTSASITNETNETNEQLVGAIYSASAAGTGAATAIVAVPQSLDDTTASTSTLEHTYATTQPTLPADATWIEGFPSLTGLFYAPVIEEAFIVPYGKILVLRVDTASFTAVTLRARISWTEMPLSHPGPAGR